MTNFEMDYQKITGNKDLNLGHKRGVFIADLYVNSNEFLRGEIKEEDLIEREKIILEEEIEEQDRRFQKAMGTFDQEGISEIKKDRMLERATKIRAIEKAPVHFDIEDVNSIVNYWKERYGTKRFSKLEERAKTNPEIKEQSYFSILKEDGSIMSAEEFIEKYGGKESEL